MARTANRQHAERNIIAIKDARRAADYVLISFHHHNAGIYMENDDYYPVPEEYVQEFCRECIDAGTDAIIGHGPHVIQGIEIYKGKPIMYSLSNFFLETETIERFPQEIYDRLGLGAEATPQDVIDARKLVRTAKGNVRTGEWYMKWHEALLAQSTWNDGKLVELKLYPAVTYNECRSQSGRPMLVDECYRRKIIDYVASDRYSGRWGTKIEFEKGVGYVRL